MVPKPAIAHPIGPNSPKAILLPATLTPPAATVPPTSHASAALVAATPLNAIVVVPVDVVPIVVAIAIASVGPSLAISFSLFGNPIIFAVLPVPSVISANSPGDFSYSTAN